MSSPNRSQPDKAIGNKLLEETATAQTNSGEGSNRSRVTRVVKFAEETVTIGFFLIMFVTVLAAVFFRYVLGTPLVWTTGVATAAFIWVLTVGAGLSNRADDHIQFDLIYEYFPPLGKLLARVVGNLLIIVPFALIVPGTLNFLDTVAADRISGTPIHFNWVYGAMLVFLFATILHRGTLLARDLRLLIAYLGSPK